MERKAYIDRLYSGLEKNFDIERDYLYKGTAFDIFGKYFIRNERYIATKKATIYGFENNEYCFVKGLTEVNEPDVIDYAELLKRAVTDWVNPHEEHMSSMITGVMVLEKCPCNDVIKFVENFKFHKSFAFGFRGWADIRLVLVLLDEGKVIINKKGKEVKNFYQSILPK
ncbi:MAG: hypothetical protein ACOYVK_09960 [Bacillota bacterium]